MATITKDPVFKEDIVGWDGGATAVSTRTSSDGYTLTGHDLDWVGVDVCKEYGGGVNQTRAVLSAALTGVGAVNPRTFFLSPGSWTITDDLDCTAYCNVYFYLLPGAYFTISTTKTLTLPSPGHIITASDVQIFACVGTGKVVFVAPGTVYPEWWGATAGADSAGAIQNSIDSVGGLGGEIILSKMYPVASSVIIDGVDDDLTLRGLGRMTTGLIATADATPLKVVGSAVVTLAAAATTEIVNNTNLINFTIDADGKTANALEIDLAKRILLDQMYILDGTAYGIKIGNVIGAGDGTNRWNTVEIRGQTIVNMTVAASTAHIYAWAGSFLKLDTVMCLGQTTDYCFHVSNLGNSIISHCQLTKGAVAGVALTTTQAQEDNSVSCTNIEIASNHWEFVPADDTHQLLIDVDHDVSVNALRIWGNRFADYSATNTTGAQIKLTGAGGANNIVAPFIENNRIPATNGLGIVIDGTAIYRAQIGPQVWATTVGPKIVDTGTRTQHIGSIETIFTSSRMDNGDNATVGAGEDDLASTVINGGLMGTRGAIRIIAAGIITNVNGGNKTIKLYFGATGVTAIAEVGADANDWRIEAVIANAAVVNAQRWAWRGEEADGTLLSGYDASVIDTSSDVTVKLTGTCADAGDTITQRIWIVDWE